MLPRAFIWTKLRKQIEKSYKQRNNSDSGGQKEASWKIEQKEQGKDNEKQPTNKVELKIKLKIHLIQLHQDHKVWLRQVNGMLGTHFLSYLADDVLAFKGVMIAESWADGKLHCHRANYQHEAGKKHGWTAR